MRSVLVALLVLGAACGGDAQDPAEPVRLISEPAAGIEEALGSIVLQPDEAPAGSEYDPQASGAGTLQDLGIVDAFTVTPGFRAAYRSAFPDVRADPSSPPPRNRVRGAISLAVLFERAADARAFMNNRFPDDEPIPGAVYSDPHIGDESLAVVTKLTRERPPVSSITWRRGNLYLFLNIYGDYPVEEALRMAHLIDARAISALEADAG